MSVLKAVLFRQWTEDLTFFPHDHPALTAEQRAVRRVRSWAA